MCDNKLKKSSSFTRCDVLFYSFLWSLKFHGFNCMYIIGIYSSVKTEYLPDEELWQIMCTVTELLIILFTILSPTYII